MKLGWIALDNVKFLSPAIKLNSNFAYVSLSWLLQITDKKNEGVVWYWFQKLILLTIRQNLSRYAIN